MRATALVAASIAMMAGVVLAANPTRSGPLGAAAGAVLLLGGLVGAVRLFRRPE